MRGVNKVILIGHLGKDPEVRYLDSKNVVANFPLATSESYMGKDGTRVEQTEWHNIVLWKGLAEVAERYLKKGSLVYIEGRIRTRSWEDKDGNKKYMTEIVGSNMTMLDRRSENGDDNSAPGNREQGKRREEEEVGVPDSGFPENEENDLPF